MSDEMHYKTFEELYYETQVQLLERNREIQKLKADRDVLVEMGKFYADPTRMLDSAYDSSGDSLGYVCEEDFEFELSSKQFHYGRRARQALKSIGEIE
jgi:hypothetical protein